MTQDRSIRRLLYADAAFCLACGLPGLLAPGWLAAFLLPGQPALLGLAMADAMRVLGLALAAYAGLLAAMAARRTAIRGFAAFTMLADGIWVLASLALLPPYGASFSAAGLIVVLLVAADTGLIGWLKLRALRQIHRAIPA